MFSTEELRMRTLHLLTSFLLMLTFTNKTTYDDLFDLKELLENGYVVKDPFFKFRTPKIKWLDPESLIPHEHTSKPHLLALIEYLEQLPTTALIPIPVVTASTPRVIIDGHHRVAASCAMRIPKIPVWEIDIGDSDPFFFTDHPSTLSLEKEMEREEELSNIRCYKSADNSRIPIRDVVNSARTGAIGFGIKGTRHVAVVGEDGLEVKLEKVTPRVMWGPWCSGGKLNATELSTELLTSIAKE